MTKGPLTYAAVILAALLMAVSIMIMLFRDAFLENQTIIIAVTLVLAICVIVVLLAVFFKQRRGGE